MERRREMENKVEFVTDITNLKMKQFYELQKGFLMLTLGDNYMDLKGVITKSLSLLAQGKTKEAHHELVATLTIIQNIETSESSVNDALQCILKKGDLSEQSYKDLQKALADVKKKSLTNN